MLILLKYVKLSIPYYNNGVRDQKEGMKHRIEIYHSNSRYKRSKT